MSKWKFIVHQSLNGEYSIMGYVSGPSKYDEKEANNKLAEITAQAQALDKAEKALEPFTKLIACEYYGGHKGHDLAVDISNTCKAALAEIKKLKGV